VCWPPPNRVGPTGVAQQLPAAPTRTGAWFLLATGILGAVNEPELGEHVEEGRAVLRAHDDGAVDAIDAAPGRFATTDSQIVAMKLVVSTTEEAVRRAARMQGIRRAGVQGIRRAGDRRGDADRARRERLVAPRGGKSAWRANGERNINP